MNEFDPIKQHRTFCPWVSPDISESLPGWRLTLTALLAQDKRYDGDSRGEVQIGLLDEVGSFHWILPCIPLIMPCITRTDLIVGFLWFRRMTLLHLLESFSWHHLRKGGGYSHQRRAENCIHLFEKLGVKLKQLIIPRHKSRKPYELKVGKFSTDICATYRCFRADARKGFVTWSTVPERYCQKPLSFHFSLWWFENVEVAYLFPVWNHLRWAYTPWFCSLVMLLYCIRYYIAAQTPVNC